MLGMILLMSLLGTSMIAVVVVIFEWRALVGYWRTPKIPHE
ncbi:hypothetical protein ML401_38860 [Bradyrhizobium sp. 62B]|nr:hypothetical protein ML401_38860 [Bradyrhizobium sp. 62B]